MGGAWGRFLRRLEGVLWQDLHPLHSSYFSTAVACGVLAALALIAGGVWAVWLS